MQQKNTKVAGAQGVKATNKKVRTTNESKRVSPTRTKAKTDKKSAGIDYLSIITTVAESKCFLNQYKNLPLSCKHKIQNFVDLLNNKDPRFRISHYPRESESGYMFYELTKYSVRENVKPTREHIPAIELVTKLIEAYYNSNEVINVDIDKLISHCESKITKPATRTKKATPKATTTVPSEEIAN